MIENPTWTLAQRMRRSRLLADLEQADVATQLGVARATVSAWETGRTEPSATNFVRWAEITGQPLEWLAEGISRSVGVVVHPPGLEPGTHWLWADAIDLSDCDHEWTECCTSCGGFVCTRCARWRWGGLGEYDDTRQWTADDEHALRSYMVAAGAL